MDQGSDAWLSWRRQGLGSSDAPVIMGCSPWKTRMQLWEEKLGRRPEPEANWAMRRGVELEPVARALYELTNNCDMPAALAEHPEHPFIRASLDGFNAEMKRVLEIKFAGKADHALACSGKIPEKYLWQVRHQLLVTGAERVDYVSYNEGKIQVVECYRDAEAEAALLRAEIEFWNLIQTATPPAVPKRELFRVKSRYAERLAK